MTTSQFLISGWSWNPIVIGISILALVGYSTLFHRPGRIWFAVAGLGVVLFALVSPINALADGYLFSAHMLQHILLLLIVPALLLLSVPHPVTATMSPDAVATKGSWIFRLASALTHPLAGWLAGVGAMWLWHAPSLCNAAATSKPVYAVQTISLLALGGVFWWQVLAPREEDRLSPPAAVLYLFTAGIACVRSAHSHLFAGRGMSRVHARPGPVGAARDHSRRLGHHSGKRSADWRAAYVGADAQFILALFSPNWRAGFPWAERWSMPDE